VQYQAGTVDFTRITQLEQNLVLQQNTLAVAQGEIAQGLIQTYRALGGGWEIRETSNSGPEEIVLSNVAPAPAPGPSPTPPPPAPPASPAGPNLAPIPRPSK
jgi:hypothetical protein